MLDLHHEGAWRQHVQQRVSYLFSCKGPRLYGTTSSKRWRKLVYGAPIPAGQVKSMGVE